MHKDRQRLWEQFQRGLRLKEYKQDFKDLLEACRKKIYQEWKTSPPEAWDDLKAELNVLDKLEEIFNSLIVDGELAKKELEEEDNG
jgi:hypothetical protein